jgi:hypothetical protein
MTKRKKKPRTKLPIAAENIQIFAALTTASSAIVKLAEVLINWFHRH